MSFFNIEYLSKKTKTTSTFYLSFYFRNKNKNLKLTFFLVILHNFLSTENRFFEKCKTIFVSKLFRNKKKQKLNKIIISFYFQWKMFIPIFSYQVRDGLSDKLLLSLSLTKMCLRLWFALDFTWWLRPNAIA